VFVPSILPPFEPSQVHQMQKKALKVKFAVLVYSELSESLFAVLSYSSLALSLLPPSFLSPAKKAGEYDIMLIGLFIIVRYVCGRFLFFVAACNLSFILFFVRLSTSGD